MPPSSDLYKAEVRDVIDADTLLLDIDLGFEVIRRQSIRLARIDAPPRDTAQGTAGRRFVREQLGQGSRQASLVDAMNTLPPRNHFSARNRTRTCTSKGHWNLNPARLPIPPSSLVS